MKTFQKLLFLFLISQCIPFALSAQTSIPVKSTNPEKPMIFSGLPERFEFNAAILRQLFSIPVNDNVTFSLNKTFTFRGTVVARVQRDQNVLSINILSSNFPGTLFNLSLIRQPDQSEKIIGRFLNPRNGDVLLLEQENDRFYITKDMQKFVMTECPLPETAERTSGL